MSFRSPEKAGGGSIPSLATTSKQGVGKIRNVKLLGFKGKVKWTQDETGLKVEMRPEKSCDHTIALKIEGA